MTIPSPFQNSFPLNSSPFNSRIEGQIDQSKNYYAVAFKPGYPLQASELNEMQEIFYVQQTLTQIMIANWLSYSVISSVAGTPVTGPGWNGCTPINYNLITHSSENDLVCNPGWYLIKDSNINGGIGVWVYKSTTTTISSVTNSTSYGLIIEPITINCTSERPEPTNTDSSLQDQTGINVINGPCGAARLSLKVHDFNNINTDSKKYLCPIITVSSSTIVTYKNNYRITP